MEHADLSVQLKTLPDSPGVYQYYDTKGNIIYVGKAKTSKSGQLLFHQNPRQPSHPFVGAQHCEH